MQEARERDCVPMFWNNVGSMKDESQGPIPKTRVCDVTSAIDARVRAEGEGSRARSVTTGIFIS